MRSVLAGLVVLAVGLTAGAEDLKGVKLPARYGVEANAEFYGQSSAKEALASAASLVEKQRYAYLLAHLMDPAAVDAQVAARATLLEPAVEKRLGAVRAGQRGNLPPGTLPEEIIPTDPAGFAARIRAVAEREAFGDLVTAMADNLSESPENVAQLGALARDGTVTEAETAATAEAKGVPGKKVFLVKGSVTGTKDVSVFDNATKLPKIVQQQVGVVRWYVEDRQTDKPEPKKEK